MIVVGGYNSANTCRLTNICRLILPRTYHIEYAEELSRIPINGNEYIGLTSGASTPDWIISSVEHWLHEKSHSLLKN